MDIFDFLLVALIGFCSTFIFLSGQRVYRSGKKIVGIGGCILGISLGLFILLFSAIPSIIGIALCFVFQKATVTSSVGRTNNSQSINEASKTTHKRNVKPNSAVDNITSLNLDNSSVSRIKTAKPIKTKPAPTNSEPKNNYPLSKLKIHKKRKGLKSYVVVDIETTGLDAPLDKIIQLSALKVINGEVVDSFDTYVNPGKGNLPLTSFIEELTHIRTSDLNVAPTFEEIKKSFLDFTGELPWVGHNIVKFDIPFLYQSGLGPEEYWTADTYLLAKKKLNRSVLGNLKLPTLKEYYHIKESSHNSLSDCYTTHLIYQHFINDEIINFLDAVKDKDKINMLHSFKGLNFVVIGEFPEMFKPYVINQIVFRDGHIDNRILKRTNFVLKGISKRPHKLLTKAKEWGFEVLSYSDFVKLVNDKDKQML